MASTAWFTLILFLTTLATSINSLHPTYNYPNNSTAATTNTGDDERMTCAEPRAGYPPAAAFQLFCAAVVSNIIEKLRPGVLTWTHEFERSSMLLPVHVTRESILDEGARCEFIIDSVFPNADGKASREDIRDGATRVILDCAATGGSGRYYIGTEETLYVDIKLSALNGGSNGTE